MSKRKFIYFIATTDRSMVKIGSSYDPGKRRNSLQIGSPVPLEFIALAQGTTADERKIHATFEPHRSHGEWFRGHHDVLRLADVIDSTGTIPDDFRSAGRPSTPFDRACEIIGSQTQVAKVVGVCQQAVSKVRLSNRRISAEWVIPIERATGGRVTRHELRPDLYPASEAA